MKSKKEKSLREAALEMLCRNRVVRVFVARRDPVWFFNLYFAEHMEFDTAPFQFEMLDLMLRDDWTLLCVTAFRGSAKTTILNTAHVLWSILGVRQSKFALLVSQTQAQAKQQMMNIRAILEESETLKRDLGPFRDETDQWGASSIVFTKLKARISVASANEAVRGIKHLQHRPDLVIVDDPEDIASARTKEGRDKTYNWFKGEMLPIGSKRTRFIVLGNVVHERCLTMRIKEEISEGRLSGIYREYPIMDASGASTWPGKYPTLQDIEKERTHMGSDSSWHREYLLKVIAGENQVVKREWIRYWDQMPNNDPALPFRMSVCAVDPAAKSTGDPTAIVIAHLYGYGNAARILVSPTYFNGGLDFPDLKEKIKEMSTKAGVGMRTHVEIEAVQAQTWLFQELRAEGWPVSEFYPNRLGDKEQRLTSVSPLIQNGQVQFHRGCEEIINQVVNFGLENHDDLCDALVMAVLYLTGHMGHGPSGGMFPGPVDRGGPPEDDWGDGPSWVNEILRRRAPRQF